MRRAKLLSLILLLLILPFVTLVAADAETLNAKCTWVTDGDTATMQTRDGEKITLRFHGIDAPERGQAYGQEAKQKLISLILGKNVRIEVKGKDHYQRTVGQVYLGKRRINLEMVAEGYAWHSDKYAPDDSELAQAQAEARAARRGLWQESSALPPWQWRKTGKSATSPAKQTPVSTPADGKYWVSKGGKIHNKSCHAYGSSQSGTYTNEPQGVNCKACGGTGRKSVFE